MRELTGKDIVNAISVDYPLSFVAEVLRENLIASGVLKKYKWRKKIHEQKSQVFDSLKNSLIDNEASIVFIKKPSPELLIMNESVLEGLTGDVWFSEKDRRSHEDWMKNHGLQGSVSE